MFKAKHSNLIFTQYEHQKLSGTLALLWGNDEFELPPCRFESFVAGVGLHDRGYGTFDNLPIGEISEEEWLDVSRKSFFEGYDDTVANIIVQHHVLRLAAMMHDQIPPMVAFVQKMRDSLRNSIRAHQLDENLFAFIDRITDLCDSISFDFCFQNYGTQSVKIQKRYDHPELTEVQYTIEEGGQIQISPWPLKGEGYTNYIIAHDKTGFPERIEPQIVPYTIARS